MSNFYANPYGYGYHGFYFDTAEELVEKLETADFEEYSIDCIDYEYSEIFHALNIGGSNLAEFLDFMEGLSDLEVVAVQYLAEYNRADLETVMRKYDDVIIFEGTLRECAEQEMLKTLDIPAHLINYIDYEAYARDCVCGGDWVEYGRYVICNANAL